MDFRLLRILRNLVTSAALFVLELPWVSKEDIVSRRKVDAFLRGIAGARIGWLPVQYIARRAQSLATSLLEALTVAYVVCALWMGCRGINVACPLI